MARTADAIDDCELGRRLKYIQLVFLACILESSAGVAAAPATIHDARGKPFALYDAKRIVTLAPHIAELISAIGAAPRIVGVSRFTDYPAQLASRPLVGDSAKLDIERIVALKPDLVIAWLSGNSAHEITRLEQLGLRVFVTESRRLDDIPRTLRQLGELIDANGAQAARAFEQAVASYGRQRRTPRLSVFYQIWPQPLTTLNGMHWISDVIALCGGENVFAALKPIAPTVSIEAVLQKNPQVILAAVDRPEAEAQLAQWRRYGAINAVKHKALYALSADVLHRPTPRLLAGIKSVCDALDHARAMTP